MLAQLHAYLSVGVYHTDVAKSVARCGDGKVCIQRALKLMNVTWVVRMSWHTAPCSYTFPPVGSSMQLLDWSTIPTSLLHGFS